MTMSDNIFHVDETTGVIGVSLLNVLYFFCWSIPHKIAARRFSTELSNIQIVSTIVCVVVPSL